MARLGREQLPDMGDEWGTIKERRERHLLSQTELGRLANPDDPIHRNTIAAMEHGASGHRALMARVLNVLDELDAEAGYDAPEAPTERSRTAVVRLSDGAVVVAVEGAVEDLAALEESAARLMQRYQSQQREQ